MTTSRTTGKKTARKVVQRRAPAAKKTPAKKVASKKTTKKGLQKLAHKAETIARKAPAKRTAKKTAKKSTGTRVMEFTPHGYLVGSDQALIVDKLVEGGFDRREVVNKAREALPTLTTRSRVIDGEETGEREKNVSSLISALLPQLTSRGYKIESSWKLVPPRAIQAKLDKQASNGRRRKR